MEDEEQIDFGVCTCCGCRYGISRYKALVSYGCFETMPVTDACENYGTCPPKNCMLGDPGIIEKQEQDAQRLFDYIQTAFEPLGKNWGKMLLHFNNEPTITSAWFFHLARIARWLCGVLDNRPDNVIYQLFQCENDYKIAFVTAYVNGAQELDAQGIAELERLGISVSKVKKSIKEKMMLEIETYFKN